MTESRPEGAKEIERFIQAAFRWIDSKGFDTPGAIRTLADAINAIRYTDHERTPKEIINALCAERTIALQFAAGAEATELEQRALRAEDQLQTLRGENERLKESASEELSEAVGLAVDLRVERDQIRQEKAALEAQLAASQERERALVEALEQLRVLPNNIDPPAPCWCGWQADLKDHSYVCQCARAALAPSAPKG